jgi:hypothetical protein
MKTAFFTEIPYNGKFDRKNNNIRMPVSWIIATDSTHHNIAQINGIPDDTYDFGVVIIPKVKNHLLSYPLLENLRRICKKVGTMQEGTSYYWHKDSPSEQAWYYSFLSNMDILFCHNDCDKLYYSGLTEKRTEILSSLMIVDNVKTFDGAREGVMIGGNWDIDYRGLDSYIVAKVLSNDITAITTGRINNEEKYVEDLKHLPWMPWVDWMYELSKRKYAVHMGVPAAGSIQLNAAFLSIPCIGYENINCQRDLHPYLSVPVGDIGEAKRRAKELKNDKSFYDYCSDICQKRYFGMYSEAIFMRKWDKVVNEVVNG